jgi:50S ribosomal subunit-associated GTPase HflX
MSDHPRLHVFNKIDRLEPETRQKLSAANGAVFVSALDGEGLELLLERIDRMMPVDPLKRLRFSLPVSEGRKLALVHGLGRVLHSELQDSQILIEAEVPESLIRRLRLAAAIES